MMLSLCDIARCRLRLSAFPVSSWLRGQNRCASYAIAVSRLFHIEQVNSSSGNIPSCQRLQTTPSLPTHIDKGLEAKTQQDWLAKNKNKSIHAWIELVGSAFFPRRDNPALPFGDTNAKYKSAICLFGAMCMLWSGSLWWHKPRNDWLCPRKSRS